MADGVGELDGEFGGDRDADCEAERDILGEGVREAPGEPD